VKTTYAPEIAYARVDGLCIKAVCHYGKAALLVLIGNLTNGHKVILVVKSIRRWPDVPKLGLASYEGIQGVDGAKLPATAIRQEGAG
jgi:hypothetical protein